MYDYALLGDQALVRAVQHGDEAALGEFYHRFCPPLRGFILRRVSSPHDADDIVQETLVAAVRGIMRFQSNSQIFTWLCGIARHKVADFYRSRPREEPGLDAAAFGSQEDFIPEIGEADLVHRALYGLSNDERIALIGKYVHRFSTAELAVRIGRTPKGVESLLTRARRTFEKEYRRLGREEETNRESQKAPLGG